MDELTTIKHKLNSHIPKNIYAGPGYVLKPCTKKISNLSIIDRIILKLTKINADYDILFNGCYLVINAANSEYKIKVYKEVV